MSGSEKARVDGSWYAAYAASAAITARYGVRSLMKSRVSFFVRRSVRSAGSHSRRCLCVTNTRPSVVVIAFSISAAWCGKKQIAQKERAPLRQRSTPISPKNPPSEIPTVGSAKTLASPVTTGKAITSETRTVHVKGPPGRKSHPPTRAARHVGARRLRRRLSIIFHMWSEER